MNKTKRKIETGVVPLHCYSGRINVVHFFAKAVANLEKNASFIAAWKNISELVSSLWPVLLICFSRLFSAFFSSLISQCPTAR